MSILNRFIQLVRGKVQNDEQGKKSKIYRHPINALYSQEYWGEVKYVASWNINRCVSSAGFRFGLNGWHPYTACVNEYASGRNDGYKDSVLEAFYTAFQPENMFEAMIAGADFSLAPDISPKCYVFPWEPRGIREKIESMKFSVEAENKRHGFDSLTIEDGFPYHGPVAGKKGEMEYKRLVQLYNSINEIGYQRSDTPSGDIRGSLLCRDGEYLLHVRAGVHRASVVAALDIIDCPIRLITPTIIQRSHVAFWPQVRSGLWSKKLALEYFDHLFDFDCIEYAASNGMLLKNDQ